jgi:hypothetical protein
VGGLFLDKAGPPLPKQSPYCMGFGMTSPFWMEFGKARPSFRQHDACMTLFFGERHTKNQRVC